MNVKTYRAKTMQEALALVRNELGSQASVLRTREVRPRGLSRLWGAPGEFEVVASASVAVPSRLPSRQPVVTSRAVPAAHAGIDLSAAPTHVSLPRDIVAPTVKTHHRSQSTEAGLPAGLACLLAELVAVDVDEQLARELVERVRRTASEGSLPNSAVLKERLAAVIEQELPVTGPMQILPGARRLVALIGPTGVGKTTTIAKLAAHYRLREKRSVGLVTVDTYRIAAVEQLRTYAEIIDLPMEIAATPDEVKQAVQRLAGVDLILMDTAGRSPRDAVRIRELQLLLAEAAPDEVHLVLSGGTSSLCLSSTVEGFLPAAPTALLLTKLDESAALGSVLNLVHRWRFPLSYLTHGQNVPADITAAQRRWLARAIVGLSTSTEQN